MRQLHSGYCLLEYFVIAPRLDKALNEYLSANPAQCFIGTRSYWIKFDGVHSAVYIVAGPTKVRDYVQSILTKSIYTIQYCPVYLDTDSGNS